MGKNKPETKVSDKKLIDQKSKDIKKPVKASPQRAHNNNNGVKNHNEEEKHNH